MEDGINVNSNATTFTSDAIYINNINPIPLTEVKSIRFRDVKKGVADGILLGMSIGLGITATAYVLSDKNLGQLFGVEATSLGGGAMAITIILNSFFSGDKTFVIMKDEDKSILSQF